MRKVDVNRERVLGLIKTANVALTTNEMGRILKVKERSVRAAVTWLKIGGFINFVGVIVRQTTPSKYGKRKYKIKVYKWSGKDDPICKIYTKDYDRCMPEKMFHGDVNLLQNIMMNMGRK